MNRTTNTRTAFTLLLLMVLAHQAAAQAPKGFIPPPLKPTQARLETKQLAPGVYALLSNKPPVDNSGFVAGERGVLVIDAHINGAMAQQIQSAVRRVTEKPILYLVNTNYQAITRSETCFPCGDAYHRATGDRRANEGVRARKTVPAGNGR